MNKARATPRLSIQLTANENSSSIFIMKPFKLIRSTRIQIVNYHN